MWLEMLMQLVVVGVACKADAAGDDVAFDVDTAGEVVIPDAIAVAGGDQVAADIGLAILQLSLSLAFTNTV